MGEVPGNKKNLKRRNTRKNKQGLQNEKELRAMICADGKGCGEVSGRKKSRGNGWKEKMRGEMEIKKLLAIVLQLQRKSYGSLEGSDNDFR